VSAAIMRVPVDGESGQFIEVEVGREALNSLELVSDDGRLGNAPFSLVSSLERALPAVRTVVDRLRSAAQAPDEITVEVGLSIGGETGIVFAKGTTEANFALTLTWRSAEARADAALR
jgi:hypothetical protein